MTKNIRALGATGLALAVAVGAGCSGTGSSLPPLTRGDGGRPLGRVIPEPVVEPSDAGDGRSAGDGAEVGFDATRGDGLAPVVVDVEIVEPATGDIVPTRSKWEPKVKVRVTTTEGPEDELASATADVWTTGAKPLMLPLTTKLSLVNKAAGSPTSTYTYADTPIDLSKQPSGIYELRVVAITSGGARGEARVTFGGDAGPTIQVLNPESKKSYKGSVLAQVVIADADFGPVRDIEMTLGSHVLTWTGPSGDNLYTSTIDFNAYMPPLDGDQLLTVTAKNNNGTVSTASVPFTVDNEGPTITNTIPANMTLIGGQVTPLEATVDDPAGIRESSVVVVFANANGNDAFTTTLQPDAAGSKHYVARFDTRVLPKNMIFPFVSFRAQDTLGNESSLGYDIAVDNTPPLAELDPPSFRVFRDSKMPGAPPECSWPVDPVGPDAVDDGQMVPQLFDVRAYVRDFGNKPISGVADYVIVANLDTTPSTSAVSLLLLDNLDQRAAMDPALRALVLDTDGDGACDSINPLLVPTTMPMSLKDAQSAQMVPILPGGAADFTPDPSAGSCAGTDVDSPKPYCDSAVNSSKLPSAMTLVTHYETNEPAVWTLPPIVNDGAQCVGRPIDALGSSLVDGWACLAIAAVDQKGNAQVSKPIRICIDKDGDGADCPHVPIVKVVTQLKQPIVVETLFPHGLATGDEVIISDTIPQREINGRWKNVTVVDATHFAIGDLLGSGAAARSSDSGTVLPVKLMPDCTGTEVASAPTPKVDTTRPCFPWRPDCGDAGQPCCEADRCLAPLACSGDPGSRACR